MTDNQTTELLRKLLDENGVEWTAYEKECNLELKGFYDTRWNAHGIRWSYLEINGKATLSTVGMMEVELTPEQAIAATLGSEINGDTSDGYHTFNELYHHRAVLFSVIVRDHRELAWKAMKHHDGTMYDGMFIVGIETPKGQATYHYDLDPYWEMFDCEEREFAPEWDGHTPDDAIARIAELGSDASAVRLSERLRSIADEMRNVGASSMKPHELLACYAHEVDKVADSLKFAATLGNGTCEVIGSYYYDDYDQYEFEFSCGHSVNMYDKEPPNYCPNCGAKVIQGVDNAD